MHQIVSFLDLLAIATFALSLWCLRHTVRAVIEGNPHTFPCWNGLREKNFLFKLKYSFNVIKATYCKGRPLNANYGRYLNQSYAAEVADKVSSYTFDDSVRLFAAGKAAVWGTLTLWFAGLSFGIKVCLLIIKYLS